MHGIIFTWGFTGILGKLIQLDPFQIVFFRMLIAGLSLVAFLLLIGKSLKVEKKNYLWKIIGVGLIVSTHWLAFFQSIHVSTVSLAVLCLATTTLHVSWLEPLVMKRKFSILEFILGLLIIVGIAFVSNNIDPSQHAGIAWGLLAAIMAALFSVFNARMVKDVPSSTITTYEMITGTVVLFIVLSFQGRITPEFFQMRGIDVVWLLVLGTICTSAAFMLMIDVVDKIGAFSASLSINLEPVYTMILAIFILNENQELSGRFYLGALFIVIIVFANPILKYYLAKRKKSPNL